MHPKRCATKLDIRDMQIKIILWCYYATVRSSRIKKNKTSEDEGQLELSCIAGSYAKYYSHSAKELSSFLRS